MNLSYNHHLTKKVQKLEKEITEATFIPMGFLGGKIFHKLLERKIKH